ncbi:MAG: hypothetical protein CM15mP125_2740 [Gammaproteobacteria bacterium]|nr:MAG: hypothetical protein CM15mP125_2740 [Gammaproteobacteria bacterium]
MSYQGHAPLVIIMTASIVVSSLAPFFFGRYLRRSKAFNGARLLQSALRQPAYSNVCGHLYCGRAVCLSVGGDLGYGTDYHRGNWLQ